MPNRQGIWDNYVDNAMTVGVNKPYLGTQQIYVPIYMADRVSTVEDLRDPQVAAMFDKDGSGKDGSGKDGSGKDGSGKDGSGKDGSGKDGSGKGEYWAGDPGWKPTRMWQVKFKCYGLTDLWEPEILPDATFKGQLKTAISREQPILFYYWTPEWMHAAYDITAIEVPARTNGCEEHDLGNEDWLEVSTFTRASSDAMIYVAYSKTLEQRNSPVAKFLSQIELDPDVVNQWILLIGRDKLDPRDVAEEWVADNMDIVKD